MLRKIWRDPVLSKVIAAGILAILGALGSILYFRPKADVSVSPPVATAPHPDSTVQMISIKTGKQDTVEEHKAFVDPETGFSFRVDEIDDGTLLWGLAGRADGVLSQYILPNGVAEDRYRYPVGSRIPFDFGGRKFVFVIVDVDYKTRRAIVRIDELLLKAAK